MALLDGVLSTTTLIGLALNAFAGLWWQIPLLPPRRHGSSERIPRDVAAGEGFRATAPLSGRLPDRHQSPPFEWITAHVPHARLAQSL